MLFCFTQQDINCSSANTFGQRLHNNIPEQNYKYEDFGTLERKKTDSKPPIHVLEEGAAFLQARDGTKRLSEEAL
jgi:hypothetical protein